MALPLQRAPAPVPGLQLAREGQAWCARLLSVEPGPEADLFHYRCGEEAPRRADGGNGGNGGGDAPPRLLPGLAALLPGGGDGGGSAGGGGDDDERLVALLSGLLARGGGGGGAHKLSPLSCRAINRFVSNAAAERRRGRRLLPPLTIARSPRAHSGRDGRCRLGVERRRECGRGGRGS